jgi:hypothetical protein
VTARPIGVALIPAAPGAWNPELQFSRRCRFFLPAARRAAAKRAGHRLRGWTRRLDRHADPRDPGGAEKAAPEKPAAKETGRRAAARSRSALDPDAPPASSQSGLAAQAVRAADLEASDPPGAGGGAAGPGRAAGRPTDRQSAMALLILERAEAEARCAEALAMREALQVLPRRRL